MREAGCRCRLVAAGIALSIISRTAHLAALDHRLCNPRGGALVGCNRTRTRVLAVRAEFARRTAQDRVANRQETLQVTLLVFVMVTVLACSSGRWTGCRIVDSLVNRAGRLRWPCVVCSARVSNFEHRVTEPSRIASRCAVSRPSCEILVPTEEVVEMRRQKRKSDRKFFPATCSCRWKWIGTGTSSRMSEVLGSSRTAEKPAPITEKEAMAILRRVRKA